MQRTGRENGAVVYIRVSTDEQANGPLNLHNQERRCRDYCSKSDLSVLKVFVDPGESARSTDRPAFQQMLAYCKQNRRNIAVVVVQDLSRLARNLQDQAQTFCELNKIGITIRSVNESSIDESPEGKMQAGIFGTFNEYFSNALSKKMKERTRAAVSAGRFPWKAPIGYINVGGNIGANIVPDSERAPLLVRAFEMMTSGKYKKTEVLKVVTDDGLKTTKGKPLTPQTFQVVLRNPLYAGWVTLPSDETFEPVRGRHEPLISQETFDRVQDVLDGRKAGVAPKRKLNPAFPLKCFVRCEACGTPLTGGFCSGRTKAYPYYWCRNRDCHVVKLRGEQLESDFASLLERLRPDEDVITKIPGIAAKAWESKQSESQSQLKRLEVRLEEQRGRKHRLLNSMLDGTISRETYIEANEMLVTDIAATEQELHMVKSQRADREAFVRFAEIGLMDMAKIWQIAKPEQRARVQNLLFENGLTYSKEQGILNRSNSSLFNVLEAMKDEKGLLASLALLSLNQFAETISNAMALSEEIVRICNDLH